MTVQRLMDFCARERVPMDAERADRIVGEIDAWARRGGPPPLDDLMGSEFLRFDESMTAAQQAAYTAFVSPRDGGA